MILSALDPAEYLAGDDLADVADVGIVALAVLLREQAPSDTDFTRAAFAWIRDQVAHSLDVQDPRVTVSAADVLTHRVGLCFAKSHLLVALSCAEGIPAGFCYRRLGAGERLAFAVDPKRGELDYADVLVRPDAGVIAALRASVDALALCQSGLPSALGQGS